MLYFKLDRINMGRSPEIRRIKKDPFPEFGNGSFLQVNIQFYGAVV